MVLNLKMAKLRKANSRRVSRSLKFGPNRIDQGDTMLAGRDDWPEQAVRLLVSRDQTAKMCDRDEQSTADITRLPLHPISFASIDDTVAFAHLFAASPRRARAEEVARARLRGE